jgi:hypothetical protein
MIAFLVLIVIPITGIALWTWATMSYTYAKGERSGFVQKLSQKGYLCKTWEGELAMANLPGAMPAIFNFTVRKDSIADVIKSTMANGQRVSLTYEQHLGIPTTCFGETQYWVVGVTSATQGAAPAPISSIPAQAQQTQAPAPPAPASAAPAAPAAPAPAAPAPATSTPPTSH